MSAGPNGSDPEPRSQSINSNSPAWGPLETIPTAPNALAARGVFSNTPLTSASISFVLGSLFSLSFASFLFQSNILSLLLGNVSTTDVVFSKPAVEISFYGMAWSFFHWAEFAVTAGWNREKCSIDSYLLDNGMEYHVAHSIALVEFLVTLYFFPNAKRRPYISLAGIILTMAGQVIRSLSMIQASTNFSHQVAFRKADGHKLVTEGLYSWSRHPSYVAFVYWALGTQLCLQNPLSFSLFFFLLYRFFKRRIYYEERALLSFFGEEYRTYRSKVPTRIPFIR